MGAAAAAPLFLLNVDKGLSVALRRFKGHFRESGRTGGRGNEITLLSAFRAQNNYFPSVSDATALPQGVAFS